MAFGFISTARVEGWSWSERFSLGDFRIKFSQRNVGVDEGAVTKLTFDQQFPAKTFDSTLRLFQTEVAVTDSSMSRNRDRDSPRKNAVTMVLPQSIE